MARGFCLTHACSLAKPAAGCIRSGQLWPNCLVSRRVNHESMDIYEGKTKKKKEKEKKASRERL